MESMSDAAIKEVIDKQCAKLAPAIQNMHGIESCGFLTPYDIHDFLVDQDMWRQSEFVGACSGSILDNKKIEDFLHLIESGKADNCKMKKTGALFFFHGHVTLGEGKFV
jgi:hypothetical protein